MKEESNLIREVASHFGRMGQSALQSKFKSPEEKSQYFRELQEKSTKSKLKRKKKMPRVRA